MIAVLAVLALIGTGTGNWPGHTTDATSGSAATATPGVPVPVTLEEFAVTPSTITVTPGTDLTVTVHNVGRMSHNLPLDGRHGTRMLALWVPKTHPQVVTCKFSDATEGLPHSYASMLHRAATTALPGLDERWITRGTLTMHNIGGLLVG